MIRRGDALRYRSIAGDLYDAVVMTVGDPDGFVGIDIFCTPGSRDHVLSIRVAKIGSAPSSKGGTAWRKQK